MLLRFPIYSTPGSSLFQFLSLTDIGLQLTLSQLVDQPDRAHKTMLSMPVHY
jgi:hypothetical protein